MLLSTPPGVSRRARRHSWALFLCRVRYFRLNFWDGNGSPPGENEVGSRRHRDSGPLAVRLAESPRPLGGPGRVPMERPFPHVELDAGRMRGAGFEPANPYGTGS